MDRVKRQLVHELAKYYRLETQSIDKEPVRSVTVSRTRDSKMCVLSPLLPFLELLAVLF